MSDRSIVLTGFMGTGKSTVGRVLAERLGRRLVDTDTVIEERHGPISNIFAERGEPEFRRIERELADELADTSGLVIATGGGFMVQPEVIHGLGRTAQVWALTADLDTIMRRVGDDEAERPLLKRRDARQAAADLLDARTHAYGRFPQIATVDRSPEDIAEEIIGLSESTTVSVPLPQSECAAMFEVGVGILPLIPTTLGTLVVADDRTAQLHVPLLGPEVQILAIDRRTNPADQLADGTPASWDGTTDLIALGGRAIQAAAVLIETYLPARVPLVSVPSTLAAMAELATAPAASVVDRIVADVATLQTVDPATFGVAVEELASRGHFEMLEMDLAGAADLLRGPHANARLRDMVATMVRSIAG